MLDQKSSSKIAEKKMQKYKKLMDSAYELFATKGINETAISEIVKKAGVAKGTFYLYFHDKYDLIDKIVLKKSSIILQEGMSKAYENYNPSKGFSRAVVETVDYIIDKFENDPKLLRIIHKNLSSGLYIKALSNPSEYVELSQAVKIFTEKMVKKGHTKRHSEQILFLIIEMVSSVSYTSIIKKNPYEIEDIKPLLYRTIRNMIDQIEDRD